MGWRSSAGPVGGMHSSVTVRNSVGACYSFLAACIIISVQCSQDTRGGNPVPPWYQTHGKRRKRRESGLLPTRAPRATTDMPCAANSIRDGHSAGTLLAGRTTLRSVPPPTDHERWSTAVERSKGHAHKYVSRGCALPQILHRLASDAGEASGAPRRPKTVPQRRSRDRGRRRRLIRVVG